MLSSGSDNNSEGAGHTPGLNRREYLVSATVMGQVVGFGFCYCYGSSCGFRYTNLDTV